MKFQQAWEAVEAVPWMDLSKAREIYDFVLDERPNRLVELGFAYGKSTVIMAAALDELGAGTIDTVDLLAVKDIFANPSIDDLLAATKLERFVNVHREEHSYIWYLKKVLDKQLSENQVMPCYDFCYLDGAHNFTVDTAAFAIMDRLLVPGGTILFDDLDYCYADMNAGENKTNDPPPFVVDDYDQRARVIRTRMSDDELKAYSVKAIFDLLVRTNPNYTRIRTSQQEVWGWAEKRDESQGQLRSAARHIGVDLRKAGRRISDGFRGNTAQRIRRGLRRLLP